MKRLIDKRCAIKHLKELLKNSIMPTEWYEGAKTAITLLQKEPTVDAEPVVRCKDCEYWVENEHCLAWEYNYSDADGYCYLGKRREDERLER